MLRTRAPACVALLAACRPGVDGDLLNVRAEVSERIPTVVSVQWESDRPGSAHVEYGLSQDLELRTPSMDDVSERHDVALLGLKAGHTYFFRAVTVTPDGAELQSAIASIDVPLPPPELPAFFLSDVDASAMQQGGYVLTSLLLEGPSWAIVLDRDGDLVWFDEAGEGLGIPTARLSRDGRSVLMLTNDLDLRSDRGAVVRVALDGRSSETTRLIASHHDFVELPDGRLAWISAEVRDVVIGDQTFSVVGDQILVATEGSDEEPEVFFNFFDDYAPVWPPCSHFDDVVFGLTDSKDWTHANSLMVDDAEDDLLLLSKNLDARLRLDLDSGELLEQIGGRYATRAFAAGATAWSHGHMSSSYEGGMLVFDNGYHHSPAVSRVREYAWDDDQGEVREVASYVEPDERFITLLGDARKLPNGDVLASWTSAGLITEMSPAGEIVWRLDTEVGHNFGRIQWIEDLYGD